MQCFGDLKFAYGIDQYVHRMKMSYGTFQVVESGYNIRHWSNSFDQHSAYLQQMLRVSLSPSSDCFRL